MLQIERTMSQIAVKEVTWYDLSHLNQILLRNNVISSNKIKKIYFFIPSATALMHLCQKVLKICNLSSCRKIALLWYIDRNRTVSPSWQHKVPAEPCITTCAHLPGISWLCMAFPPPGINLQALPCFPMHSGDICLYHKRTVSQHHFYLPLLCTLSAYRKIYRRRKETNYFYSH